MQKLASVLALNYEAETGTFFNYLLSAPLIPESIYWIEALIRNKLRRLQNYRADN